MTQDLVNPMAPRQPGIRTDSMLRNQHKRSFITSEKRMKGEIK
jgi:hypothetical protein